MEYYEEDQPSRPLRVGEHKKKIATFLKENNDDSSLPVTVKSHRKICQNYWGEAWCRYVSVYDDYGYRLGPGRSYVRAGAVVHLEIEQGKVSAKVLGSSLYEVEIDVSPLDKDSLKEMLSDEVTGISSMVDLLEGKIPDSMSQSLLCPEGGLFPQSTDIKFSCTCTDYATMCKHVGATLYGIGVRFDEDPHLFFHLRGVDPRILVQKGVAENSLQESNSENHQELGELFGIDWEGS